MNRNRLAYLFLIILIIVMGLGSRLAFIPAFIYPYLGDVIYTTMYYFLIGFIFPKSNPLKVMLASIGLCFLIEISQVYQAEWINQIRAYKLGGLILGYSFLWSDLISYTIGGISAFLLEKTLPVHWKYELTSEKNQ